MGKLTHPNYTISPRKMQTLPASRTGSASKFVKIPKPPTAENSRFRPNRGAQAEKFGNKLSARQGSSYSAGGDRAGVAVDIIISRIRRNAPGGHQGHRSGCGALQLITEVQVRHGSDHRAALNGAEEGIEGIQSGQGTVPIGGLSRLGQVGTADGRPPARRRWRRRRVQLTTGAPS